MQHVLLGVWHTTVCFDRLIYRLNMSAKPHFFAYFITLIPSRLNFSLNQYLRIHAYSK